MSPPFLSYNSPRLHPCHTLLTRISQASIDVEAAVRLNGGGLDVGIWFPECIRGSEELGSMMEGLQRDLAACCD